MRAPADVSAGTPFTTPGQRDGAFPLDTVRLTPLRAPGGPDVASVPGVRGRGLCDMAWPGPLHLWNVCAPMVELFSM